MSEHYSLIKLKKERVIAQVNRDLERAWEIKESNPKVTLSLAAQAYKLAKKVKYKKGMGKALRIAGVANAILGNHTQALKQLHKALEINEEINDPEEIAHTKANLGAVYQQAGQYHQALKFQKEGLHIAEKYQLKNIQRKLITNTAALCRVLGDYNQAEQLLTQALQETQDNSLDIALIYLNLGAVKMSKEEWEKAQEYFEKALKIGTELGQKRIISFSLALLGEVASKMQLWQKAEDYFLKALTITEQMESKIQITDILLHLAKLYLNTQQLDKALNYAQKALNYAEEIQTITDKNECFKVIADIHEAKNDLKTALQFYKKHTEGLEAYYKNLLNLSANAMQVALEAEQERKEKEIYRLKNIELAQALRSLETYNKQLTSSLQYARQIQDSIFPQEEQLQKLFPNSFLWFLPKEIVCGDFAWIGKNEEGLKFVAAADCTGHGVAAALMSMLGYNLLNEAITEKKISDVSQVLSHLHVHIRKLLHQDQIEEDTIPQSMEMALVAIDAMKQNLYFSGAFLPLWIVLPDGEVRTISADQYPIGGYQQEPIRIFSMHTFTYPPKTKIYLITDGFINQIGGKERKPYSMEQLKTFLGTIASMPIKEQKEAFEDTFTQWQGDNERIDDILVIGIELL